MFRFLFCDQETYRLVIGNQSTDEETDPSIICIGFSLNNVHPLIYESCFFRRSTQKPSVGVETSNLTDF